MSGAATILASDAEAIAAARDLAHFIGQGTAERDRTGAKPVAELEALGRSGLLGILVPRELGGAGVSLRTVAEVLRILANADLSFAQVPQPHYVTLYAALLTGDADQRTRIAARALAGERFANALSERGTPKAMDFRTTIRRGPDGVLRVDGRKFYCTGSFAAEWLPTYGLDDDGRILLAWVRTDAPGLQVIDDWLAVGQRSTASGTAVFTAVAVDDADVVELWRLIDGPQIWNAFARFLHAALDLGVTEAALAAGRDFLGDHARPWVEAGVARASDEAHIILRFGELLTETAAVRVLLDRAGRLLGHAAADLTEASAAAASAAVAEVKAAAADLAVTVTTDVFAVASASAADESVDFGRLWRDARVHTIHDPARWSHHAAGHYAVHGDFPRNRRHGGAAARPEASR